jgi:hypothetical protein
MEEDRQDNRQKITSWCEAHAEVYGYSQRRLRDQVGKNRVLGISPYLDGAGRRKWEFSNLPGRLGPLAALDSHGNAPLILVPKGANGVYLQPVEGLVSSTIYIARGLIPFYGKLFFEAYASMSGQAVSMTVDIRGHNNFVVQSDEYYH